MLIHWNDIPTYFIYSGTLLTFRFFINMLDNIFKTKVLALFSFTKILIKKVVI